MDFPKDRIEFTQSHKGDTSEKGWLVLNINGVDLEGVHKIYVDLADLDSLRQKKDRKAEMADQVRALFAKETP
ncbi:MAG: hypothetical protein HY318_04085 [Armatimonadetes bacterium]|nr:hypothetical protein [Armatimonadota bacterium]